MRTNRLADLIGSAIVDASGRRVGHVVEVAVDPDDDFALTALIVGTTGWLDRLDIHRALPKRTRRHERPRIPWTDVERIDGLTIHLKTDESEAPAT